MDAVWNLPLTAEFIISYLLEPRSPSGGVDVSESAVLPMPLPTFALLGVVYCQFAGVDSDGPQIAIANSRLGLGIDLNVAGAGSRELGG